MKYVYLLGACASALILSGCGQKPDGATDANPEASAPVNSVQDAASAAVGPASAVVAANTTAGFASAAALSDMYEVQAADIAISRSKNAEVLAFAKMMKAAHTETSKGLKTALKSANSTLAPPTALDERRKGLLDNLNSATSDRFDEVYIDQQTSAHREALTLFRGYADGGDTPAVKAFAAATAPKIEEHLNHAEALDRARSDEQPAKPGA